MRKSILGALTLVALIALLSVQGFAYGVEGYYYAEVQITGEVTLIWFNNETYTISINETFIASVPDEIPPGEYDAKFEGYATITEETIEFYGMIEIDGESFKVEFTIPNEWPDIPTGKCMVFGEVHVKITESELPPTQYTWVHIVGPVTDWNGTPAWGWLCAHAKISANENVSRVYLCWVPQMETPYFNMTPFLTNFTFSFYAAKLVETESIQFNYQGNDFYISGLWTVLNITFTYTYHDECIDYEWTEQVIAENATGELKVYDEWSKFTVSIANIGDVNGLVRFSKMSSVRVLEGDVTYDGVVNINDLVHVARRIGSTPGWIMGQMNFNLEEFAHVDINFDFQIDIHDLVSVATEIEA